MTNTDPRIDAYIAKSAEFARPILTHLRKMVHEAAPEIRETIKWGMPHFDYKGMVCGMAAFKEHCAFGFWKEKLVFEGEKVPATGERAAMGTFGRITSIADLPAKSVLARYVKRAVALNEAGIKSERRRTARKAPLKVPADLAAAFKRNGKAKKTFDAFSPSQRREYVEWLTEAKRPETRAQRLAQAIEWMAEGKPRNWKYMRAA
jgi:uncharacterized protein YdeI (YjbR/CyaY-like superfamily)